MLWRGSVMDPAGEVSSADWVDVTDDERVAHGHLEPAPASVGSRWGGAVGVGFSDVPRDIAPDIAHRCGVDALLVRPDVSTA
jgi:hypothetical protein